MAITLLATSDLHLGRRSSGLPAPAEQASAIETWRRIVETAIKREVDAVVLSGDIIDQENYFFESIGPLTEGMNSLADARIPVYLVAGNHDFDVLSDAVHQSDTNWVHFLGSDGTWEKQTLNTKEIDLQIVGRSFTSQSLTTDVLENFEASTLNADLPAVGLVHGEVDNPGSVYGPLNSQRLIESRVDAWVIGHIHKPARIRDQNPLILYPGSPHAFSAAEQGNHGPWLLHIHPDQSVESEQLPLSPIRFESVDIDISEIENKQDFRRRVTTQLMDFARDRSADLHPVSYLVFDVQLKGTAADPESLRDWSEEIEDYYEELATEDLFVSVRKVKTAIEPALDGLEEWARKSDPVGILSEMLLKMRNQEEHELVDELIDQWKVEIDRVNRSDIYRPLRNERKQVEVQDEEARRRIQRECENLLTQLIRQQNNSQGR